MKLQSRETLTALMAQRYKTQSDLARAAGCSRQFVHKLATGTAESCSLDVAVRIARCLGVNLDVLFVPTRSAGCGISRSHARKG